MDRIMEESSKQRHLVALLRNRSSRTLQQGHEMNGEEEIDAMMQIKVWEKNSVMMMMMIEMLYWSRWGQSVNEAAEDKRRMIENMMKSFWECLSVHCLLTLQGFSSVPPKGFLSQSLSIKDTRTVNVSDIFLFSHLLLNIYIYIFFASKCITGKSLKRKFVFKRIF